MEDNDKPISERLRKFLKDNIAVLPFLEGKIDNLTEEELDYLFTYTESTAKHRFWFGRTAEDNYSAICGFDRDTWETKEYDTYSEGLEEAIIEFVNSFNYIDEETGDYLYILKQQGFAFLLFTKH